VFASWLGMLYNARRQAAKEKGRPGTSSLTMEHALGASAAQAEKSRLARQVGWVAAREAEGVGSVGVASGWGDFQ